MTAQPPLSTQPTLGEAKEKRHGHSGRHIGERTGWMWSANPKYVPDSICGRGGAAILSRQVFPGRGHSGSVGNAAVGAIAWLLAASAYAQTDEIQVYDADINSPGQFSLQLHNNYTPIGRKMPDFEGGIVPNHTLNGVPEWAYGVTDWLELGAYVPLYSWTGNGRFLIDGAKLRAEFVVPHAQDRDFFYGVNFELGFNAHYWDPIRNSGEIRGIIGGRIGPIDLILNPILDTSFQGLGALDFAPAARLAYNLSGSWAAALEHYADYGRLRHFQPLSRQQQTLFAVVDYRGDPVSVEFGIGHGFTAASDALVLKMILSRDF